MRMRQLKEENRRSKRRRKEEEEAKQGSETGETETKKGDA